MKKKIYLAGKMTGMPDSNYPAFNEAARRLREQGHEVLNPAENPVPACGTWEGYMRMGLKQLMECEAIALLPGWIDSRGAVIERNLALILGMAVLGYGGLYMGKPAILVTMVPAKGRTVPLLQATDWSAA